MEKTTKKDLENKAILKPCKTLKNKSDTDVLNKAKKRVKGLKKGLKGIDPVSNFVYFKHLASCSSIILPLLLHYRLNNRADVYIVLVLLSNTDPLSLSALTRLAGLSSTSYTAQSVIRLIDKGIIDKSLSPSPVYCLSISCKDKLLQLINEV